MKSLVIVIAILVETAAYAQSEAPATDDGTDANETICRTSTDTGSRLNRTRICRTRAEWEAARRETRQNVERSQTRRVEKTSF
jgi:hypothetical protein